MANLPPTPDSGDDLNVGPGREYPGIPRWVKVFGIIVIIVVLLLIIILVTGVGGEHGPGRHIIPSGDTGGDTPPIEQSDGLGAHTLPGSAGDIPSIYPGGHREYGVRWS